MFFEGFSKKDFRFGNGVEVEKNTFRRGNNVWYHYFSLPEVRKLFGEFGTLESREVVELRKYRPDWYDFQLLERLGSDLCRDIIYIGKDEGHSRLW